MSPYCHFSYFSYEIIIKFLMKNCIYHSFFFCSILNVSAIVLANLCVSYIMTSQNEEAEELMRKIEKEEEQVVIGKTFSCIVEKKVDLTKKKI